MSQNSSFFNETPMFITPFHDSPPHILKMIPSHTFVACFFKIRFSVTIRNTVRRELIEPITNVPVTNPVTIFGV